MPHHARIGEIGLVSLVDVHVRAADADPADARTDTINGDVVVDGKVQPQWGLHLIDAPVSGGAAKAANGEMTVMASGRPEAFAAVGGLLDAVAGKVYRLADHAGVGSTVKMVNQHLAGVHIATACEAMALGMRAGADPKQLYEVICNSAGMSWMFQNRVPHILDGDYTPLSSVNIFVKDLGIVLEIVEPEALMDRARAMAGFALLLGGQTSQAVETLDAAIAGNGADLQPQVSILTQYVKDLSFENPNAPRSLQPQNQAPNIGISVNVNAKQLSDTDFEVDLTLEGKAGEAPDIPEVIELLKLGDSWRTADKAGREKIWHRMLTLHAEQQFTIGVINNVQQPVVVSNALKNVPEKGLYNWEPGSFFGMYRPETFWFTDARRN